MPVWGQLGHLGSSLNFPPCSSFTYLLQLYRRGGTGRGEEVGGLSPVDSGSGQSPADHSTSSARQALPDALTSAAALLPSPSCPHHGFGSHLCRVAGLSSCAAGCRPRTPGELTSRRHRPVGVSCCADYSPGSPRLSAPAAPLPSFGFPGLADTRPLAIVRLGPDAGD